MFKHKMFKVFTKKINKMKFLYVYIVKSSIFSLVFTVFCLWLTIQLPQKLEMYLAYVFILSIGIIHGANDLSLIKFLTLKSTKSLSFYVVLYVSIIIFMGTLFFYWPLLALIVFVALSCYHFGEQHFFKKKEASGLKGQFLFFSYGLLIFGLLFSLKSNDSTQIILELTNFEVPHLWFQLMLLSGFIFTVMGIVINRNSFNESFNYFEELFLLLVFALIFKLASLLWAFNIYFIIWHSIPSLKDQITALHGTINKKTFLKYFKSSLLNWLVSLVGLYVIYRISIVVEIQFITLFFAFLAAITVPHAIVMFFLNKEH